ncbi:MAG TPA: NAD-dependent deacylase [Herpetosiphonaceae bacterium]
MERDPTLLEALRSAKRVAVLTGAGISAESGIPTFRDAQTGLWARFRAEDLASPEAFERDPQLVWDWYAMRRELVTQAAPNPGHYALAELERRAPSFLLATQNVDGLHQRAGSQQVIELHGNIGRVKCSAEGVIVESWEPGPGVPRCPGCGALLRPDVVWFGELLPAGAFGKAQQAVRNADLVFTIGTSGLVPPAATLPLLAAEAGALVVEINLNETYLTPYMSHSLRGPSGEILPALVKAAWPDAGGPDGV